MIDKILGNRYVILEKIGIGGMSEVYKAVDQTLKRNVAIKVLKDQFSEDTDFLRNFSVEAQAAAGLNHPNIINIYDVGMDQINGKEIHYIVMEYIDGETLKSIIQKKAPLSMKQIKDYGIQISKALEIAHHNNIVHRDIKPQNIMITKDNQVKVTDFGIAKVASSSTIAYTSTVLGTVHYISPEQAKGKYVNKQSDIYALGVVLYEMATGQVPYDGENSVAVAIKHIQEKLVPAKLRNPNISTGLDTIISKCLKKRPEDRYHTIEEVIEDLLKPEVLDLQDLSATTMLDFNTQREIHDKKKTESQNVYRSKRVKKDGLNSSRQVKKKGDRFRKILFPLILSLLILGGIYFGYNYLKTSFSTNEVIVPNLINHTEAEVKEILKNLNLTGELVEIIEDETVQEGRVVRQDPLLETKVKAGSTVRYYLSGGAKLFVVPDLINLNINELESKLSIANLNRGSITYENSDDIEKDKIISQDPLPKTEVPKNTKVNVVVSKGKAEDKVSMPNLVGKSLEAATNELHSLGLKVKLPSIEEYSEEFEKGIVMDQDVPKEKQVPKNTEILLSISLGKKVKERNPEEKVKLKINLTPDPNRDGYPITIVEVDGGKETPVYSQTYHKGDPSEVEIWGYADCLYAVYHGDIMVGRYKAIGE